MKREETREEGEKGNVEKEVRGREK
jgi:hypothetical protein